MLSRFGTVCNEALDGAMRIDAVIFDGDGVITNNQVLEGLDVKPKWRSHYDGQGISLLRAIGIRVCFITNEEGISAAALASMVERWNSLPSTINENNPNGWSRVDLYTGRGGVNKVTSAEEWLSANSLWWANCAVMGDDLVDVPMLRQAGLRVAPASAEYVIQDMAHFISRRIAGAGAIRDFANFVLHVRKIDPTTLPTQ